MGSRAVRAVLVDAFGTLVRLEPPAPRLREALRAHAGIEVSEAEAERGLRAEIAFYLAHHLEGRDPKSLDSLRDACARVLADAMGLDGAPLAAVRAALLESLAFTAYPDAAPTLAKLRAAGLRIVAASNWDISLPRALEQAGLSDRLDAVVASAQVGEAKPAPGVFAAALAAAGVAAGDALHVGDSPEKDVEGARAAGIRAVLLRRAEAGIPEAARPAESGAEAKAVRVIAGLDELLPLALEAR